MKRPFIAATSLFVGLVAVTAAPAYASWPEKPIKVIVGYKAGGLSDVIARTVTHAIEKNKLLPQPIVVVNVPGAGTALATRQVKESDPDGYTLLMGNNTPLTASALGALDFGPEAFEPIAETSRVCVMHLVGKPQGINTLAELVKKAKAEPKTITEGVNFGATGHIHSLMFNDMAGIETRYVQGGGSAKRAKMMAGGTIAYTLSSTLTLAKFGDLGIKGLAYMSDTRHPRWPDIPTDKELGYDMTFCVGGWWWAPKGAPNEAIDTMAEALGKAMKDPEVLKKFDTMTLEPTFMAGEAYRKKVHGDYEKFVAIAKKFDVKRKKK